MKEVFVVYGWTEFTYVTWAKKPPVFEIFNNFDSAFSKFQECVKKAFDNYKSDPPEFLNKGCVEESFKAELFADYNCGRGFDYSEGDVLWGYEINNGESAEWAIHPAGLLACDEEVDFPNIHLEKMEVAS